MARKKQKLGFAHRDHQDDSKPDKNTEAKNDASMTKQATTPLPLSTGPAVTPAASMRGSSKVARKFSPKLTMKRKPTTAPVSKASQQTESSTDPGLQCPLSPLNLNPLKLQKGRS